MRKIAAFLFAFLILVSQVDAAVGRPVQPIPTKTEANLTAEQFSKISVKEYQKLTGKKMNVAQKLAFKAVQKVQRASADGKSQITAALLAWLLGWLGIHRFYLGYTWQGVVQLLTLGGLGIWALIDLIRIIIGDLKPKNGEYEKTF